MNKNPCKDNLSDIEFLIHMIPHHQVAIDMSKKLEKVTSNPDMQNICRNIIWQQKYEIAEMKTLLHSFPNTLALSTNAQSQQYLDTIMNFYYPKKSKSKGEECNPMFFDPNAHMKHQMDDKIDDKKYLEHMIPHHQVAVDMAQRLILHTNNTYMHHLAFRVISSQQHEIKMMNEMLNNINNKPKFEYTSEFDSGNHNYSWYYNSELLGNNNHNFFYENENSTLFTKTNS